MFSGFFDRPDWVNFLADISSCCIIFYCVSVTYISYLQNLCMKTFCWQCYQFLALILLNFHLLNLIRSWDNDASDFEVMVKWLCLKSLRTSGVYREPRIGSRCWVTISKWLLQSHLTMLKTRNAHVLKWRKSTSGILTSGTADFRHFKMCTWVF